MAHPIHNRGIVHIWAAILVAIFVGFVGLAIDTGYATLTAQQLQAGADAAALAGATYVRKSQAEARTRAVAVAAANTAGGAPITLLPNPGNAPGGDIVIGRFVTETGQFIVTTEDPNAVRVRAARASNSAGGALGLLFGPMFGMNTVDVRRTATAVVGGHLPVGALILAELGPCAFRMQGTAASLVVHGGAVYINSDSGSAACAAGQPFLRADELLIHGAYSASFEAVRFDREIFTRVDKVVDPLAALPEPNIPQGTGSVVVQNGNNTRTILPGHYREITVNNGTLIMSPGVYIVNGPFAVTGGNLIGDGVMIYVGPNGSLDFGGNGDLRLSAMPTLVYPTGPAIPVRMSTQRVVIFQSRSNTRDAQLIGTGTDHRIGGRIYLPRNRLGIGGSGKTVGSGLIVGTLDIFGNGDMIVTADPFLIPKVRFVYLSE